MVPYVVAPVAVIKPGRRQVAFLFISWMSFCS